MDVFWRTKSTQFWIKHFWCVTYLHVLYLNYRLKKHYSSYEPTLRELKQKYETAMKEKMLTKLERDRAVGQVQGLKNTLKSVEHHSTAGFDTYNGYSGMDVFLFRHFLSDRSHDGICYISEQSDISDDFVSDHVELFRHFFWDQSVVFNDFTSDLSGVLIHFLLYQSGILRHLFFD